MSRCGQDHEERRSSQAGLASITSADVPKRPWLVYSGQPQPMSIWEKRDDCNN